MGDDPGEANFDLERGRARREAEGALHMLEVALLRADVALDRVGQARREVTAEEAKYSVGEGTQADLEARRTALTEAGLNEIRARGEILRARIEYLAATARDPYDYLMGLGE